MSEQTTTQDTNNENKNRCCGSHKHEHRGHCLARTVGVLVIFGIGFLAGKTFACEPDWGHGPAAFMAGEHINAEQVGKFADKRVQHLLDEVKANDAQKTKASGIVKAALTQGAPLAEKMRANHAQMHKLMSAATLNKAAIESLRAEQIKLADETSKLATQTLEDVAEVLTPEQRAKLAEKMEQHGGWGHHG